MVLWAAGQAATQAPRPAYLPGPSAAPQSAPGFQLQREVGKGWSYRHAGFVAWIGEDGSIRFENQHGSLNLVLPVPLPLPEGTATLEGALRKLGNPRARGGARVPGSEPPARPLPRMSPYRPDPTEVCRYPAPCYFQAAITLISAQGTFDLTDEILRLSKSDPYRNQKAAFLASTQAFRQELGARARRRAQAHALDELRKQLDAIDADPKLDAAARRAALQALADELDPDPSIGGPARALIDARLAAKK